jgi:excisionase family DNA binding protein
MREILTIDEATKYLRIHKATLYKLVKQKRVPAVKVGKKWRLVKSKLDEWLEKQSEVK